MDGVTAEIAQKIAVRFEHGHIDSQARQQVSEHHARRSAAGHAAASYTIQAMPLIDQISTDMTAAMRAGEQEKLDALRMVKAALMKYKVDTMKPLDEQSEVQILTTLIKQRRESADMFRKGNRPELADKEERELKIVESYMPSAPTEEEIEAAIAAAMAETGATSAKQMGAVMKATQARLAGKRVDGKALSEKVRAKLN